MVDINKDRARKFIVWVEDHEELAEVPAGQDADTECADILDVMLGNIDSGWSELPEDTEEDCQ